MNREIKELQDIVRNNVKFRLFMLITDDQHLSEMISLKNQSKIIIISEFFNEIEKENYLIICFENYLFVLKPKYINQMKQFFEKNSDSIVYCSSEVKRSIDHSLQNAEINFSKDNEDRFFYEEINSFSNGINQFNNNNNHSKLHNEIISIIDGFYLKTIYMKANHDRLKNFGTKQICQKDLNNYFDIKLIACSDSSSIYLIYNKKIGELMIRKILKKNLKVNEKEDYLKLNHPLISKHFGFSKDDKIIFIEYINGCTLKDIKELNLSNTEKINIIFELLIIFQYIHSNGFVYCDLKPLNVMIDKNKMAVLVDFDSMILISRNQKSVSYDLSGDFIDPYVNENNPFTYKSDIYSIGLMIYYIIMEKLNDKSSTNLENMPAPFSKLKNLCKECIQNDSSKRPTIETIIRIFYRDILYENDINHEIVKELICILEDNINKHPEIPEGFFVIGLIYFNGRCIPNDVKKAKMYWELAVTNEYYDALNNLACSYIESDINLAINYYKKACEKNSPNAFFNLFLIYYDDKYGLKNKELALKYLEESVKLNFRDAQYEMANFYFNGLHYDRNIKKAIDLFQLSVEQNFSYAQLALGKLYLKGDGVEKNLNKAIYYIKLAKEQNLNEAKELLKELILYQNLEKEAFNNNNIDALYNLGVLYYEGELVDQDITKAIKLFSMSAEQNHLESQIFLGDYYYYYSKYHDINAAIHYYTLAANQGNSKAQLLLGMIYSDNKFYSFDLKKAKKYFKLSAKQGCYLAQYKLGKIYSDGFKRNIQKAINLFKQAGQQGCHFSQHELGIIYFEGKYVNQDIKEAIKYFTFSAEKGLADSQNNLGLIYSETKYGYYSINKALYYYNLAVKQNNKIALNNLGLLYYFGTKITRDVDRGIYYLNLSANLNYVDAIFNLACIYYQGLYIKKNMKKTIEYLERASKLNHSFAQINLGMLYYEGKHIKQDIEKALYYLNLSANQDNAFALNNLGSIYLDGIYVKRDVNKAIKYLTLSAKRNNVTAQANLAKYFAQFDINKAIYYYEQASSQNDFISMFDLAMIYYEGKFVKRNMVKTIHYLKELSSFKQSNALNNLGIIYKNGYGVEKNIGNAIEYFENAVKCDDIVAMFNLANIYFYGDENVEKNLDKAMEYLTKYKETDFFIFRDLLKLVIIEKYKFFDKDFDEMKLYKSNNKIVKEEYKKIKPYGHSYYTIYKLLFEKIMKIELIYIDSSGRVKICQKTNKKDIKNHQKNIDKNFYDGFLNNIS